jgi:hypothetical protein
VFKVIETPIAQDKPSPLPTLPTERNQKNKLNFLIKCLREILFLKSVMKSSGKGK